MINLSRYLRPKAVYIARMGTRDTNKLKIELLNTLIEYAVEHYDLDDFMKQEAIHIVEQVVEPLIGKIKLGPKEEIIALPNDWRDVIKQRETLYSFKQLDRKEIEYHNKYCKNNKCAFGPNQVCPVCKFGKAK